MIRNNNLKNNDEIAGIMWKTVSEACNLACDYCYYSTCKGRPGKINKIDYTILEKFIKEYMAIKNGYALFVWQGGEPLLAGLDFFKEVVKFQAFYAKPNTIISNSIQTNGTLIDEKWANFFKKYRFLVGVSLDGPKKINNKRRITGSGKGSYESVMRGIQHLKDAAVDFNILTVIHEDNVTKAKELMDFYLSEGFTHVQFIPCMNFKSQYVNQTVQYAISPKQYGDFLCEIFDIWYNDGNPQISIQFFDNMLAAYLNQGANLCQLSETCPKFLVLEQNGDAYPCDFFLDHEYKLGNVGTDSLENILSNKKWDNFLTMKQRVPEECKACEYINLCHGGCPRNRKQEHNVFGMEYFCESYKQIFHYAHLRMVNLANHIRKIRLLELKNKRYKFPSRNEPCICGSGKKFKKCCYPLLNLK